MRPANLIADATGVLLLTAAAALPLSCTPGLQPPARQNLQPLVATAGAYGIAAAAQNKPSPSPEPSASCEEGCKCAGTGQEPSGDGLSIVSCRCPDTCACKAGKATETAHASPGVPGWAPKSHTVH